MKSNYLFRRFQGIRSSCTAGSEDLVLLVPICPTYVFCLFGIRSICNDGFEVSDVSQVTVLPFPRYTKYQYGWNQDIRIIGEVLAARNQKYLYFQFQRNCIAGPQCIQRNHDVCSEVSEISVLPGPRFLMSGCGPPYFRSLPFEVTHASPLIYRRD